MLKIGEFAKLANISVKALRHYEACGLLKPVTTDRYSGYRYYSLEQLPRLQRILALKEMGFSLAQVGRLLDGNLSPADLRRYFDQKQAELAERVRQEQTRLQRVAIRLTQIEREGRLPLAEVLLKRLPALWVASKRTVIRDPGTLAVHLGKLRAGLAAEVRTAGIEISGPWLTLYSGDLNRDADLGVEVATGIAGRPQETAELERISNEGFNVRKLPNATAACLLVQPGGYTLSEAFTTLYTWAEQNHWYPAGPQRELHLEDPAHRRERYLEVQLPVETIQSRQHPYFKQTDRKEDEMEPRIVHLPAFTVVGLRYFGKNENQEISGLWGQFNPRIPEIRHISPNSAAIGLCSSDPQSKSGEFEYVASFAVDDATAIPEGMVVRQVPASQYAVFTHVGDLKGLGDTYHFIYHVWLPQSGYSLNGDYDFEWYDQDFKDFAPDSRFYIYLPVKK